MELDEAPAPTSRLDHLAELATSPTHANVHPPASSSSSSTSSTSSSSRPGQQYTHHPHSQQHDESSTHNRTGSQSKSHSHNSSHSQSRPHMIQQQLEAESGPSGWSRSPITPTTTRKFNRMAIHEVLDGQNSPSFKRKGSPEEGSFSDPPTASSSRLNSRVSSSRAYGHPADSNHPHHPHHAHFAPSSSHQPNSPRFRQESPMPASNSEDDEDSDIRNYKKRRMLTSSTSHHHQQNNHHSNSNNNNSNSHPHPHHHHKSSPSSSSPNGGGLAIAPGQSSTGGAGAQAEVMDQVRNTLKLKQQQKAIIEARQGGALSVSTPTTASSPPSNGNSSNSKPKEGTISQPVTEKNPSGISVFHGSASFAALNRRPLTSPKNPKNAKSLTIFAPSYSESSLSIRSAPLQPSHGHNIMSMNPRTSQPLRHQTPHHHQPHPFSQHQHQATPTQSTHGSIPQPLRSPKTAGHVRKSSRATLRAGLHTAGLDSSSGTLPAPILSSHTGPLPSPMYPHPNTPFHPSSHASLAAAAAAASTNAAAASGTMSKHHFIETVSNLFDSVDSSRSLKHTLEEQIRKSAQLLQTLQSSGTMIESLVRGQFKELEKGVLEKFESELDHLSARVRQLEEHQGLTPPPKKARISPPTPAAAVTVSSQNAMTGIVSTSNSTSTLSSSSSSPKAGSTSPMSSSPLHNHHNGSGSSMKDGMLPTPPLNKTQDSAMEVEDDEELPTAPPSSESATTSTTPPPQQQDQPGSSSEYRSSVKKLQERVASLEKRQEPAPASATATVQA
ncbi:hypothetical protein BGX30_009587 [Mortierella sp. GBA39]|nr:hypothetical protein BGX30_009587 [Mortierella sp. GBA39]